MHLLRHTRFLLLVVAFAVFLIGFAMAPGLVGAQETTSSETDEVLTRYDSPQTAEMAAQYEADRQREQELEDEIEALEAEGEYGPERSALREELSEIPDDTDLANQLGDSRFRDVQDAPVEGTRQEKIEELKRKAASLYSLQSWSDEAPIDVNSELYYWSAAEKKADEFRAEAEALEAAAAAPETVEEQTTETTGAAAPPDESGGGGGEEQPVEETPEEAAPEPENSGPGIGGMLAGINLVPIIALIALVGGAIFAFSRASSLSLRGYLSPAMASVPKKPKPKSKPSPKKKTKAATSEATSKPANLEDEPEEKPEHDEIPPGAFDSAATQEWFEREMSKPDEDDQAGDEDEDDEPPV